MLISPIKIPTNFQGQNPQALVRGLAQKVGSKTTAPKARQPERLADSLSSKIGAAVQKKLAQYPNAPKGWSKCAKWFFG